MTYYSKTFLVAQIAFRKSKRVRTTFPSATDYIKELNLKTTKIDESIRPANIRPKSRHQGKDRWEFLQFQQYPSIPELSYYMQASLQHLCGILFLKKP